VQWTSGPQVTQPQTPVLRRLNVNNCLVALSNYLRVGDVDEHSPIVTCPEVVMYRGGKVTYGKGQHYTPCFLVLMQTPSPITLKRYAFTAQEITATKCHRVLCGHRSRDGRKGSTLLCSCVSQRHRIWPWILPLLSSQKASTSSRRKTCLLFPRDWMPVHVNRSH